MKKIIYVFAFLSSITVFATSTPAAREVSTAEAATAIMHCGTEAQKLTKGSFGSEYVSSITVSRKAISEDVAENTYTVNVSGAGGFLGIVSVGTLTIVQTITQPDARVMDKPADVEWKCSSTYLN